MLPAGIGTAHRVGVHMGELSLDGVGVPHAAFVEERRSGGAEAVRGDFLFPIAHAAEGGVERVFGYWAQDRPHAGEHEPAAPGEWVEAAQYLHRLPGQGRAMGAAHLHALGRDRPDGAVEVEFAPFGGAQFAGTGKEQRQE